MVFIFFKDYMLLDYILLKTYININLLVLQVITLQYLSNFQNERGGFMLLK